MTRRPPKAAQVTVGAARALLAKARHELADGENRQAAEKGWLAAVTAAKSMLQHAGEDSTATTRIAARVYNIENARHMSHRISIVLEDAARDLHGVVFYGGTKDVEWSGSEAIERLFQRIDTDVIEEVASFLRTGRRK